MFTGIILFNGVIESLRRLDNGARILLRCGDDAPFARGESLAVNGVCLTVIPQKDGSLVADVSDETLSKTTLGSLGAGARVNLERALAVGDRLGGHIVQGHVDAVGALISIATEGDFAVYRWSYPPEYANLLVNNRNELISVALEIGEHFLYGIMTEKGIKLYHKYKDKHIKQEVKS